MKYLSASGNLVVMLGVLFTCQSAMAQRPSMVTVQKLVFSCRGKWGKKPSQKAQPSKNAFNKNEVLLY